MLANEYLTKLDFNVDVLMFDVLMSMRKDNRFSENILEELNEYIHEKTQYEVEFIFKDMNEGYDITNEDLKDTIIKDLKEQNYCRT